MNNLGLMPKLPRHVLLTALGVLGLLLTPLGEAQEELNDRSSIWRGTPDDSTGPWKEFEDDQLPGAPVDENLRVVHSNDLDERYLYQLDRESLVVSKDNIFRYTIVIEAPTGVRNVFYEGLRCETREFKTFAYLSHDNAFRAASRANWKPIKRSGLTIYRRVLLDDYVCQQSRYPRELAKIGADLEESHKQANRAIRIIKPERDSGPARD